VGRLTETKELLQAEIQGLDKILTDGNNNSSIEISDVVSE
jgi:hypothetical protein